jgi:hypothetical protein
VPPAHSRADDAWSNDHRPIHSLPRPLICNLPRPNTNPLRNCQLLSPEHISQGGATLSDRERTSRVTQKNVYWGSEPPSPQKPGMHLRAPVKIRLSCHHGHLQIRPTASKPSLVSCVCVSICLCTSARGISRYMISPFLPDRLQAHHPRRSTADTRVTMLLNKSLADMN